MSREHFAALSAFNVPQPHGLVVAPARQQTAATIEGHRVHPARMPMQNLQPLARGRLPEVDRLIFVIVGEKLPIGTEGHRVDPTAMPQQRFETLPTTNLPEPHRLILSSTDDPL